MQINSVKDIGLLIKARRLMLGLTREEAAGLCDVGTRFLFDIENGKSSVQLGKVLQVARRFGITLLSEERPIGSTEGT